MQPKPTIRKVLADSVPYGRDICAHGNHVWAAYSDGVLVCVAATAPEARRKYRKALADYWNGRNRG
jgi:hypothetical protein